MTCLADLAALSEGTHVRGLYHLSAIKAQQTGRELAFVRLVLKDQSAELTVYCWPERFAAIRHIKVGGPIEAAFEIHRVGTQLLPRLLEAENASPRGMLLLQSLTQEAIPNVQLAAQLEHLIRHCPVPSLQCFLDRTFERRDITLPFLTLPASRAHHHAWPGGLAGHSLEVTRIVYASSILDSVQERALGLVARLFHDLGKIRSFKQDGRKTRLGRVVPHTHLTLEMLAPTLPLLDRLWPDGAIGLRYLLGWPSGKGYPRPLIPIALLVEQADRYNAATSARCLAAGAKRPWQQFASLPGPGPRSTFWYPEPA